MEEPLSKEEKEQMLTFLTVEHSNLQNARSSTVFESGGRATLYLTFVSSMVVALAFIGNATELGQPFFVFSLVLLPAVLFVGIVTFERAIQSSLEDWIYGRGINRIRHFYTEIAPRSIPYFIQSIYDDGASVPRNMGIPANSFQLIVTTSGMIAVINSLIGAIIVAMLLTMALSLSLWWGIGVGVVAFAGIVALHIRYQLQRWAKIDADIPIHFPPPEGKEPQTGTTV